MIKPASKSSAVVATFPEAMAAVRAAGGIAGRRGELPPHVTILWPFLPAGAVDDDVVARLRSIASETTPFDVSFDRVDSFPEAVYASPDRPDAFVALTESVWAAWPDHPPYEGKYDSIVPHMTLCPGPDLADRAAVEALLPVRATVREVRVVAQGWLNRWRTIVTLPLGPQP